MKARGRAEAQHPGWVADLGDHVVQTGIPLSVYNGGFGVNARVVITENLGRNI